jgi:UDP:flavonoid glycosyltransferase YjiC (YdhE family)
LLAGLGAADADVTFTVGALDPGSLGPIPANVRIAPYLPQQVAMQCDIVVTHGGSGTTAAALTRGLPIVAIPLFADQPHNATQIARAGVGVIVDQRRIATDVGPAIATVAADPSYAAAAQRISREIGELPSVGDVMDQLIARTTVPV